MLAAQQLEQRVKQATRAQGVPPTRSAPRHALLTDNGGKGLSRECFQSKMQLYYASQRARRAMRSDSWIAVRSNGRSLQAGEQKSCAIICQNRTPVLPFFILAKTPRSASGRQSDKLITVYRRAIGLWAKRDFFIWIHRNPLISPNSAKGIQGNASFFAWISLDLLVACRDAGVVARQRRRYPTCFFRNSSVRVQASLALGAS